MTKKQAEPEFDFSFKNYMSKKAGVIPAFLCHVFPGRCRDFIPQLTVYNFCLTVIVSTIKVGDMLRCNDVALVFIQLFNGLDCPAASEHKQKLRALIRTGQFDNPLTLVFASLLVLPLLLLRHQWMPLHTN